MANFIEQSNRSVQSKQHPMWEQEFNEEMTARNICVASEHSADNLDIEVRYIFPFHHLTE